MQQDIIMFRGTYLYRDLQALDRTLAELRRQIGERSQPDIEWFDHFTRQGARLFVRAELPGTVDVLAAATIVETLARDAIEGVVEAQQGDLSIRFYPCGEG